jgi:hypothetical protein
MSIESIKHFVVAAATACLVTAFSASAQDTHDSKAPKVVASANPFAALDRNGDHRISRSEAGFDHVLSQTFAEIDTDGDGFVSTSEYATAEKTRNTVSSNLPNR